MRIGAARCISKLLLQLSLSAALLATTAPAAANNTVGAWSSVNSWPLIAVHAVLMPDGRVLSYGTTATGQQTGAFIYDVWDPSAGLDAGHLTLPNIPATDLFCSSQVVVPQGDRVFIAGGDNWVGGGTTNTGNNNSNTFDYNNNTLTRNNNMNRARWYSSSIALPNGEIYIQGGSGGTDRPEIRDTSGAFRLLTGADTSGLDFMFPRNFVAPDGRVFGFDSNGRTYYVNTNGAGAVTVGLQFSGPTGTDASAAMYRPGKILQIGGNSNTARIIDITSGTPVVSNTTSLSSRRRLVTATVLADGRVLATGGSEIWNDMTGVNYNAEIWNPTTNQWLLGPPQARARLYHSTAVLMPDASVLVAGGGAPGPQTNLNMEIYYPPYLYDADSGFATRPVIDDAPTTIDIGETFGVVMGETEPVSRVALIKTASVSHSWNTEQRFIELTFLQNGANLIIQAPTRAGDAPPGFYLLFVFNSAGTPTIAKIAKIGVAANPNPSITPILTNPGNQAAEAGVPVQLQLSASDPNGDTIGYGASGLPPGIFVDPATGELSGMPTVAGTFNVVVSASDGVNSDTENFVWTVAAGAPFILNSLPPSQPAVVGATVTFAATVTGGAGIQYQWDFADGTPPTAFAPSSTITHQFAQPGIYYVTVTARDFAGALQATTIVQRVHLPLTANRPEISTNIVFEDRATGTDRFWIVNQDHDSVSAFNATTNAKLSTITVGTAPRALAVAPTGEIWVTNKDSSSISVIGSGSLAITRTISLPFASQPYGIIAAPTGGVMYVALAGSGRVLRIDAASGNTQASVAVGANVRQLSMAGDGSRLYVSRFITSPLPGESTASVQTQVAGQEVGGEVIVVDPTTMTVLQSVVLRHSDKSDFENQGRGIPNYLGAVAVSPDGQSAWIPSKQDNVMRGEKRDGNPLNFQNTVRAISSRVDLVAGAEDYARRIDHNNSGVASAIAYDQLGTYMFVALETSRQVAVVDAHAGFELFRFAVGRAPQGLALSADGNRLYVNNFLDRTVNVFDLSSLLVEGIADLPLLATRTSHTSEKLSAQVLQGKRLFYDALDTRLALDAYVSCASCHNDGGHDGRVWDLTGFGEGLRNTVSLRGRAGAQGALHWSNNFDEVQDFEGQIRNLSGGSGLMTNEQFNSGTRSQPLGDPKAGISADLDALAAYVKSLNTFASSPLRNADGNLTPAGVAGRSVFIAKNCASCHSGTAFTVSAGNNPQNVGTLNADSGNRLGGPLTGIDVPTLRDAWVTAPYLHRGSAATIEDAILAHEGTSLTATELANLSAYVAQIGNQESAAPLPPPPGGGTGAFQQGGDGTVSIEAEHFSVNVAVGTSIWSQMTVTGASGGAAMRAPTTAQPRLEYQVNFNRTGTHYVYLRSYGLSGSTDSAWIGFNGNWQISYVEMNPFLSWQWEGPVQINVTSVGQHTIGITRRESNARVDKIVILPTATVPTGIGPVESGRDGGGGPINNHPSVEITSPTGNISVTEGTAISFSATASDIEDGSLSANLSWNSSRDGLIGLNAGFSISTLSAGTHTITASVSDSNLDTGSDSITVTVNAQVPGGAGAFQQGGDGTVSIEAEHFSVNVAVGTSIWSQMTVTGASGGAAMRAPTTAQPRLEYQVNFNRTGTHYVYLRSYGLSGSTDSAWIGFNGNWQISYVEMNPFLSWQWEGPVQINVTSVGQHTIGITRRESNARVDKIVILPTATVPTGLGPIESPH